MAAQVATINEFVYSVVRARRANLEQFKVSTLSLSLSACTHSLRILRLPHTHSRLFVCVHGGGAAKQDSGDLLSLFLNDAAKRGEELSDDFLRDVILNFLIAGRDTTACALTYMFKALSEHPGVESEVCDEVYRVLGAEGAVDEASLRDLTLLEALFLETSRLWAPVAFDVKHCVADCVMPDGSRLPAGTMLAYSPYCLNRLHTIWGHDAQRFNPHRWIDTHGHIVHPSNFKFASFNAGPRLCLVRHHTCKQWRSKRATRAARSVSLSQLLAFAFAHLLLYSPCIFVCCQGKSMAIMEAKVLASAILQRYSLRVLPTADLSYRMSVVLALKHGLPVTVRPRQNEL